MTSRTRRLLHTIPAMLTLLLAAASVQAQQAAADAMPVAQDSSDQNVPRATARQQAAEIAAGDPPRWYREDTTPAARLKTMQKEMAAGLQEAKGNCRRQPGSERAACLKQAQAIYRQDMAAARGKAMAASATPGQ